ncbi:MULTISPECIES: DUF1109 domain-containing protein [Pseudomonas]|uniref:DUF1109 domain-containing protein n=1 Tax=Pseudomonas mosselii TaxID=78327 RepID=A0A5R8ZGI0_9PSED|nr:DUF1109 domain-containing protein [Pseudomonas mosselii]TLP64878.1 DUF1109 domain-containing protein [Pseudomonas mosselii]
MKTNELIDLLSARESAVDRHLAGKRFAIALVGGALGAALLMAALFGVRPDLGEVARTPLFWAKVALPGSLALLALWLSNRLARPGVRGGAAWVLLALPALLVWIGAALQLAAAPADMRADLILGKTWRTCPLNIALLSVPTFVGVFWTLRGLAPTRLRIAGAAGGLLAGATATLAYCLHCPEMGIAFWGVWYLLGMLLPTAIGALLGPSVLRW